MCMGIGSNCQVYQKVNYSKTSPEGEHIVQPLKGGAHCQPHGGHPLGGGTTTSADTRRRNCQPHKGGHPLGGGDYYIGRHPKVKLPATQRWSPTRRWDYYIGSHPKVKLPATQMWSPTRRWDYYSRLTLS